MRIADRFEKERRVAAIRLLDEERERERWNTRFEIVVSHFQFFELFFESYAKHVGFLEEHLLVA